MSGATPGTAVIFGEVLFDHFPDGKRVLGGAPFNVAWHLQAFGQSPRFVSRVGDDLEGEQVRHAMKEWGMGTGDLQIDARRPTGRVAVSFDDGEPHYDIVPDCAYDAIEPLQLDNCRLLYHGSLAVRSETSASSLRQLRAQGPQTVFIDINLRPPWWQPAIVEDLLAGATWVKLNSDELALLGEQPATAEGGRKFLQRYGLDGLLITHGANGAELVVATGERLPVSPAENVRVVDTVGAGDAFASIMLLGLLNDWPMPATLARAQRFAAAVVGCRGATISDRSFYRNFQQEWQLV
jgi:fructokinase